MLLVALSEPVELLLLFPQDAKTLAIAAINTILFIMDLSFRWLNGSCINNSNNSCLLLRNGWRRFQLLSKRLFIKTPSGCLMQCICKRSKNGREQRFTKTGGVCL